jgi:hypothetical protein
MRYGQLTAHKIGSRCDIELCLDMNSGLTRADHAVAIAATLKPFSLSGKARANR